MTSYDGNLARARADARSRAARTVAQGLALTVAAAVLGVLVTAVTDLQWTRAWWGTLVLLAAKSAIQAGVAYLHRLVVPPPS